MRLIGLILENFRAYRRRTYIEFEDLSAFIGRNDYGKSTILEALEIFFNSSLVKIDRQDVNVRSETRRSENRLRFRRSTRRVSFGRNSEYNA